MLICVGGGVIGVYCVSFVWRGKGCMYAGGGYRVESRVFFFFIVCIIDDFYTISTSFCFLPP